MKYVEKWQYNGIAPMREIEEWCNKHFEIDEWMLKHETIYFLNKNLYAWFLIRWS